MLKRIDIQDLRLGMHLHAFEGPWLSHPFWRTRFVVQDKADLARARDSAIRHCWIDTARGLDVETPDAPAAAAPAPAATPPLQPSQPTAISASFDDELAHAASICKRGRAAMVRILDDARLGRAVDPEQCLPLVHDISSSVLRNPAALVSLARLKTHDDYSYMHSVAVCALMVALGRQLGLDAAQCEQAGLAGLLHDIGKALMPIAVLNKPGKLTDAEFNLIKQHAERGHALLLEGNGVGEGVLQVCLHHHERWDGTGYPHRLAGAGIAPLARMGAVCDVYDAVTSNRPYKRGWDPAESIARMASWKGHFDTAIFAAFVRSIGIYPTGSLLRMESGRLAVVVEQHPSKPAAPVLKVFFSTKSNMPIPPQRLDMAHAGTSDRIAGRESAEAWGFKHIDDYWATPVARR